MDLNHFSVVEMQNNRAEYEYLHNGKGGISTAFQITEKAEILLNIPRTLGTIDAYIDVFCQDEKSLLCRIKGEWSGIDREYDSYVFEITNDKIGTGLYFLRPRLSVFAGELFGHKWAGSIFFDSDFNLTNMMQMTICDFKYEEAKKIRGGVIYHVFVDRFNRGGPYEVPDGARVIGGRWNIIPEYPEYPGAPLRNNTFFGGTLWGIIEKLDYIKSLGTTAIYLSPIFSAYSNHKYDTADYMTVDPIFGGEVAFKALIAAAGKRGIEIILDGVFNHTGSDSIYFNKYGKYQEIGAYQSRKSKYYDWFDFKEFPNKYTCWWDIDILPRINPDNPSCGSFFVGDDGVIAKYRDMGIYGFRLDVADELSDAFIGKIKNRLSSDGHDRILYGEVWEDASNKIAYDVRKKYYQGEELDGVMNYPLRKGIIDYILHRGYESLAYALTDVTNNAPSQVLHNQMNLLGTHDTERILTVLGGESAEGKSNYELARVRMDPARRRLAVNRLMSAYTVLATMPGIPAIFYGDEAGLEGYSDPFNRMPFPWGKEEQKLLKHYQNMGRIRQENDVYRSGDFRLIHIDCDLLIFARLDADDAFITVLNNSDEDIKLSFDYSATELLSGKVDEKHKLSANGAAIFKVDINSTLDII